MPVARASAWRTPSGSADVAITDEDRARLGELAARALDRIEQFGPEATLEDAVLVYEVSYPDPDHDGELAQEVREESTTHRATVVVGLCAAEVELQLSGWARED